MMNDNKSQFSRTKSWLGAGVVLKLLSGLSNGNLLCSDLYSIVEI
jgi:hypothetical protein